MIHVVGEAKLSTLCMSVGNNYFFQHVHEMIIFFHACKLSRTSRISSVLGKSER